MRAVIGEHRLSRALAATPSRSCADRDRKAHACAQFGVVSLQIRGSLTEGRPMTNHVRMGVYSITKGTYDELIEQARRGLAPILRESPGFVFYSTTDVGGGRFVSVSTWETREQAEAAAAKIAEWVGENMADSVALEENLIGEMTTLAATERSAV